MTRSPLRSVNRAPPIHPAFAMASAADLAGTKAAALAIYLQRAQVEVSDAAEQRRAAVVARAEAEIKADQLRAVIDGSGSENMQRIVRLQADLDASRAQHAQVVDTSGEILRLAREMEGHYRAEVRLNQALHADVRKLEGVVATYVDRWLKELEARTAAQKRERREQMLRKRAQKSRNKAQRRLYALRARAKKAGLRA